MEAYIIDIDQQRQTLAWGQSKYGFQIRTPSLATGEKYWKVLYLRERRGPAGLYPEVFAGDGVPIKDVLVALDWPDAPNPPEGGALPPTGVYPHDWAEGFVYGKTDANGIVGFGLGKGSYHGGEGGPHSVWVHHPTIKSEVVDQLGMLAATFHDAVSPVFVLAINGGGDTTPPDTGGNDVLNYILTKEPWHDPTEGVNILSIICVGDEDTRKFYETRGDLLVGNDPDNPDWESEEPIEPGRSDGEHGLDLYHQELWYTPGEGEQSRNFWFRIRDWTDPQKKIVTTLGPFETRTHEGRIWHVEVKRDTGDGGDTSPPDDESPDIPDELGDNLAELFGNMADVLQVASDCSRRISQLFGKVG